MLIEPLSPSGRELTAKMQARSATDAVVLTMKMLWGGVSRYQQVWRTPAEVKTICSAVTRIPSQLLEDREAASVQCVKVLQELLRLLGEVPIHIRLKSTG